MPLYISPPPRNPLVTALAAIVGVVLAVSAFFLGFVVLLIIAGVGSLAALAIFIRIKWLQRSLRKQGIDPSAPFETGQAQSRSNSSTIEGEYTVVSKESDD